MRGPEVEAGVRGSEQTLRLSIPPQPTSARLARQRVSAFAAQHGVGDDDLTDFLTAIGEAIANAIEHGRPTRAIEIVCWIVGGRQLMSTVVDTGVGFESTLVPDAQALSDPLAMRGRGFALMRRCTDLFAVRSAPGSGTAVILGRTLQHAASTTADNRQAAG